MPHVVLAPDSFKGTMTAMEVAQALALGMVDAGWTVDVCPVADGGEGTVAALCAPETWTTAQAVNPRGDPIVTSYGWLDPSTAVIEAAAASGLTLIETSRRDAEAASTSGTGILIVDAVSRGATRIMIGCGGSATTDGGMGAVTAIGDAGGLRGAELELLTDVTVPFEDAAVIFGPQKGADPAAVERLTARLHRIAAELPRDPRGLPGTGAAGGLAGGLWSMFSATIVDGAAAVLDGVGFDSRAGGADLVVTGEGRIDEQTFHGKLISQIARRCMAQSIRCVAVVGRNDLADGRAADLGLEQIRTAGNPEELRRVAREIAGPSDRQA